MVVVIVWCLATLLGQGLWVTSSCSLLLLLLALLLGLLLISSVPLVIEVGLLLLREDFFELVDAEREVIVLNLVDLRHGEDPPDVMQVLPEGGPLPVPLHVRS